MSCARLSLPHGQIEFLALQWLGGHCANCFLPIVAASLGLKSWSRLNAPDSLTFNLPRPAGALKSESRIT